MGDPPPMPAPIERPAGQPDRANFTLWLQYLESRRERAEIAGLDFEGQRDAYKNANELNTEQLRQCNAWAAEHDGH